MRTITEGVAMNTPIRLFTDHPASVGESYWTHCRSALYFSAVMLMGAIACALHAFLPFFCTESGSRRIRFLHEAMVVHRRDRRTSAVANQRA